MSHKHVVVITSVWMRMPCLISYTNVFVNVRNQQQILYRTLPLWVSVIFEIQTMYPSSGILVVLADAVDQWWIVWWGGVRVNGTDDFVWYTTREPVYGTWCEGEPNGLVYGENCIMLEVMNNTYMDISCNGTHHLSYVCEFHDYVMVV